MLRGRVDPKKEEQERLQGLLLDMLKEEENKYCADCQAKTPRWAAWNLGIFICIRCAGIHRNLGVHISKVRSVNLDTWTAEQVQTMRVMGNEKARQVYEHELPAQFRRPISDGAMEQFIRSKYEQKRYMLRDFVYPRVDVSELPKSLANSTSGAAKKHPVVSISSNSVQKSNGSATVSNLLDFSDPPATNTTTTTTTTKTSAQNLFDDFAGLSMQPASTTSSSNNAAPASSANDDFDDFGSFVSASSNQPQQQQQQSISAGFADFSSAPTSSSSSNLADLTAPPPSTASQSETNGGKKSNADILSLFGSSGVSTSAAQGPVLVAPGGFTAFGLQAAPQTSANTTQNDLYGGLGAINFNAPAPVAPAQNALANNFSQFGAFGGISVQQSQTAPTTTGQQSAAFNIPNKSNAFADLALGKVMKTNYGQSALTSTTTNNSTRVSPQPPPSSSSFNSTPISTNNDLFDMFATAPPPAQQAPPTSTSTTNNFDDLLSF